MQVISIHENGICLEIEITETKDVRLIHFGPMPYCKKDARDEEQKKWFRLVELQLTGENQNHHHGSKYTGTAPGSRLCYDRHKDFRTHFGRKLEILQKNEGLVVTSHLQFFDGIPIVRSWTEIANHNGESVGIEYVSSFALTGLAKECQPPWDKVIRLHLPHNNWKGEAQWKSYRLSDLGFTRVFELSIKHLSFSSTGTWSTAEYLPMGCLENSENSTVLFWQIEHNGSWHWEIGDVPNQLYLQVSGPTFNESHWWKKLAAGQAFQSVPVAIGTVCGTIDRVMGELTQYRRTIRRTNRDNEELPIIFNDYMNCLFGDPTTEKLLPLIDAAAEVGCEYFCIDAGWYADGDWWDEVGLWQPSQKRFPGGLGEVLDRIRSAGMIPGLWLEIEVMGINCPLAHRVPDAWFFQRHGKQVIDHGRYQLDFRNREVIEYANSVIDRLVNEYGIGYIKMDYNINAGPGTDLQADSLGDGLLEHNRAYLNWLDNVFERFPTLIIENCASGGLRMDYAMLSRHSIQSSSDQTDFRKNAVVAAASPTAVTPEQCAVWSYPLRDGDSEETIFNMVNAMLMRVHQSGHLADISPERRALVKEGLSYYKKIRRDIRNGLPFWPLGLPSFSDEWISLGLRCGKKTYLSVWRLESEEDSCSILLRCLGPDKVKCRCGYPLESRCKWEWDGRHGRLNVELPKKNTARLFEFEMFSA
ncbi:MAG: alpha-galactosidase [Actinobacteria bacterium]|nr:alpha-galactosidase [Actinomycetota bacterium]